MRLGSVSKRILETSQARSASGDTTRGADQTKKPSTDAQKCCRRRTCRYCAWSLGSPAGQEDVVFLVGPCLLGCRRAIRRALRHGVDQAGRPLGSSSDRLARVAGTDVNSLGRPFSRTLQFGLDQWSDTHLGKAYRCELIEAYVKTRLLEPGPKSESSDPDRKVRARTRNHEQEHTNSNT